MPAFDRRRPRREEAPINFHFFSHCPPHARRRLPPSLAVNVASQPRRRLIKARSAVGGGGVIPPAANQQQVPVRRAFIPLLDLRRPAQTADLNGTKLLFWKFFFFDVANRTV